MDLADGVAFISLPCVCVGGGCVKVAGSAEGHCLVLGVINCAQTFGGGQTLLG